MKTEVKELIDTFVDNILEENTNVLEKNGVYKVDHPKIVAMELPDKLRYAANLSENVKTLATTMTKEMNIVIKSEYIILLANIRPFKDVQDCKELLIYFHNKGKEKKLIESSSREFMMDITAKIVSDLIVDMNYDPQVQLKAIMEGMKEAIDENTNKQADINRKVREN